jgi:hypothetical protein
MVPNEMMGQGYGIQGKTIKAQADYIMGLLDVWWKKNELLKPEILLNPALEPVAFVLRRLLSNSVVVVTVSGNVKPPLTVYIRKQEEKG